MAKDPEKKPSKRPSAVKREIRNKKRQLINKSFKSNAGTILRNFFEAARSENREEAVKNLNTVYSVVDKGVKRGIFKQNKANRIKSRLAAKLPSST